MIFRHRFPLQSHGRKRLVVCRNTDWTEISIVLDGYEIGRTDAAGIANGYEIRLWDHSLLRVWLERGPRGIPFLYVTRNGHPLTGSAGDPEKILRDTVRPLAALATLQIVFGLMVVPQAHDDAAVNWILGLGCVLAILLVFASRRSLVAMVLASILTVAELVAFFATQARLDFAGVWSMLAALSLLGFMLLRGIGAVRDLRAHRLPIREVPKPLR